MRPWLLVHTENSTYEIDRDGRRIRRIEGANEPTPRFSEDGLWHDYAELSHLEVDRVFHISWLDGGMTLMSTVLDIEDGTVGDGSAAALF